MKIVLIEDEEPASERLERMLMETEPTAEVVQRLVSIKSSVEWFRNNEQPDLIMMDIQLADGNSFEIFRQVKITCPVIFTTAFDQYAVQAFRNNGIDYLLKPIKKDELAKALKKYHKHYSPLPQPVDYDRLLSILDTKKESYQQRIVIRFRDEIKTIELSSVAYFFIENKITYLVAKDKKQHAIDDTLDELEKLLDPAKFFRINRQFIVNIDAIEKMVSYSKSRVKLFLKPPTNEDTVVSTERSPEFKTWLLGK